MTTELEKLLLNVKFSDVFTDDEWNGELWLPEPETDLFANIRHFGTPPAKKKIKSKHGRK